MKSLLDRARDGESLADLDIVDLHGHLGTVGFAIPDSSAAALVEVMDAVGVAQIACSTMSAWSPAAAAGNDEVLAAMRDFPGRILGYVAVWPADAAAVREEVEKRLAQGFTGIKLHNANGFEYDDPAYEPAFAIAHERRLPVLLHTWGEEKTFRAVRPLAEKYPDAALILAHAGAADEAGYAQIARDCPGVWLDPTLSAAPRGLFARFAEAVGADRIVWGSDAIFLSLTQQVGRVLGAKLADEDKQKILSGNARRILGRIRR
jgi:predicted TIM-barrel fold metal-dependent hydrolase